MSRVRRMLMVVATVALVAAPTIAGGTDEGIEIHGHWLIEVFAPDGTLVSTHDFENAYVGAHTMAAILRGEWTPGLWEVILLAGATDMPCDDGGFPSPCIIVEPQEPQTETYLFKNLTVSGTTTLVLSGTATCANASDIDMVQTFVSLCDPATATAACTAGSAAPGGYMAFTQKDLATPVSVQPGFIVQVTVNLSFS